MLTKSVEKALWEHRDAWLNPTALVNHVCRIYAAAGHTDQEPNYASIIRIAARLKKQPRFRAIRRRLEDDSP